MAFYAGFLLLTFSCVTFFSGLGAERAHQFDVASVVGIWLSRFPPPPATRRPGITDTYRNNISPRISSRFLILKKVTLFSAFKTFLQEQSRGPASWAPQPDDYQLSAGPQRWSSSSYDLGYKGGKFGKPHSLRVFFCIIVAVFFLPGYNRSLHKKDNTNQNKNMKNRVQFE